MLTNVKEILLETKEKQTAIGAFNIFNLEVIQGVVEAAVSTKTPAIVAITEKSLAYGGDVEITSLAKNVIEQRSGNIKMGLHLDHGRSFEACKRAIEIGFNSIMIDGSTLSFEENKSLTKRVVEYAHKSNIPVQGELGTVPYLGKHQVNADGERWEEYMTDPDQAKEFVDFTGIDTLAVAIGNAHGFQKERDIPDWNRLKQIKERVDIPLILHGASDWTISKIKKATERGINCFNVDTDIRVAFIDRLCNFFEKECTIEDPRKVMELIRNAVRHKVEGKIRMFRQ